MRTEMRPEITIREHGIANIPGSRRNGETADQWAVRVWRAGWVPACGGTEIPQVIGGRRYLYCVDLALGEHAWIDLDTDMPANPFAQ